MLSVAYATARNRCGEVLYTVCTPVCADTVSLSQADSLALAMAESMALMMDDSLSVVAPDTTLVVADTTVAVADTIQVDSVALKNIIPDSLIVGYMPERTSWKYFEVKERTDADVAKLKTLYKKALAEHNGALNAYDGWKVAFNSTNDRTLDMYVDGARMILSRYCADTLNQRYDRLQEHRDELMELYDLAIHNLDTLNAQLDMSKIKDTLSVAKFRSRQLRYYRDITMLDSIYNGDSTNLLISRDTLMNRINNDITHLRFMYPRYKEIVTSTDMNVDMVDIAMFAILSDIRIVRDKETGLKQDVRKANFEQDCELVRKRVDEIFAYIEDPASIIYKDDIYKDGVTIGRWFNSQRRPIDEALRYGEGRFIDVSNFESLENYWAERFQKEGDYDAVINGPLERHKKSETYIQALRLKFDVEPSFELAKQISERSLLKAEQRNLKDVNFKDAISYLERSFKFPEFSKQSSFAQAQMYVSIMKLQLVAKRTQSAKNYLSKAKKACSAYPDVYYYEASLLSERNFGNSEFVTGIKFCAVYDLYALCLKKFKELKANPGSEIKTSLEEEDIKTQMQWCEQNFMSQGEAFANGIYESGKRQTKIGEYNTVIRFAK
jgi:hypothetical protein